MTLYEVPLYSAFAGVYDATMHEVPYKKWSNYIKTFLKEKKINSSSKILEAACGTGSLLKLLQDDFPATIGIDKSLDMLKLAGKKSFLPLVQGDVRNLPFPSHLFDAALTVHDSINYLRTENDLSLHFHEISRVLKPGGIYIFDISSELNVIQNYHERVFNEEHSGINFSWKNTYDPVNKEIISILEFSESESKDKKKSCEIHIQKIYTEEMILKKAHSAGFQLLRKNGDYSDETSFFHAQLQVYFMRKLLHDSDNK